MVFNNDINLDQLTQQLYFEYWTCVSFGEKRTFTEYVQYLDIGVYVKRCETRYTVIAVEDWKKFLFARLKYGY